MKKFQVHVSYAGSYTVELEAESAEAAREIEEDPYTALFNDDAIIDSLAWEYTITELPDS